MSNILVAGDDPRTLGILDKLLKTEGYRVRSTVDISEGRNLLESESFDLLINATDPRKDPDLELAFAAKSHEPPVAVILIGDEEGCVEARAAELHPAACIGKPLRIAELLSAVQKVVDYSDAKMAEDVNLNMQLERQSEIPGIVAESPAMKSICSMISRVSMTDVTVLIVGEQGVGKSAVAAAIHAKSRRSAGAFVSVDCSRGVKDVESDLFGRGSHKGAIAAAKGGTLHLRSVDRLGLQLQQRLLEGLDQSDIRVIADATAKLQPLADDGRFDAALYRFLKVVPISIPPLRDRPADILPGIRHVLRKMLPEGSPLPTLEPAVAKRFQSYAWPGNLDEMERVIGHALKTCREGGRLTVECLPRLG